VSTAAHRRQPWAGNDASFTAPRRQATVRTASPIRPRGARETSPHCRA
jgi:hypothetical protein